MTIPKLAAAALLMCISTVGWSQASPEDHAAHHPPEKAATSAPAAVALDSKMTLSKNDMAAIRGLLEKAEQAKTPAERERLLAQHLAGMRKQLATLESQHCEMEKMEGGAMGGSPRTGAKPGMMEEGMKDEGMKMEGGMKNDHTMMCHQLMTARVDAVMELLEQTWRREELLKRGAN